MTQLIHRLGEHTNITDIDLRISKRGPDAYLLMLDSEHAVVMNRAHAEALRALLTQFVSPT